MSLSPDCLAAAAICPWRLDPASTMTCVAAHTNLTSLRDTEENTWLIRKL